MKFDIDKKEAAARQAFAGAHKTVEKAAKENKRLRPRSSFRIKHLDEGDVNDNDDDDAPEYRDIPLFCVSTERAQLVHRFARTSGHSIQMLQRPSRSLITSTTLHYVRPKTVDCVLRCCTPPLQG